MPTEVASHSKALVVKFLVTMLNALSVVLEFAVARTVNEVVVSLPTALGVPESTPAEDRANPEPDKFEVVSA